MAAKKKKKMFNRKPLAAWQVWGVGFTAAFVIAFLSLISMPLGALGVICAAIASVLYEEKRQRASRDTAVQAQFEIFDESMQNLSFRVQRNLSAIEKLKLEVETIKEQQDREARENRAAGAVFSREKVEVESIPRAIRPGVRVSKSTLKKPPVKDPNHNAEDYDFVSDVIVKELLHHALDQKRVDVFVQPIVRLPQRQPRFYEMFARIRAKAGLYLPASRYMKVAEQDNLNGRIDDLLLLHCLKTIEESAHLDKATPFFININRASVTSGLFMKRLLGFLSKNRHLAPRLVFEMAQKDFEDLQPALLEIIRGLGTLGCSFSLDHVEDVESFDIMDLHRHKVRFIKLHVSTLLSSPEIMRAKRKLEGNGIGVIVEHIETEEQIRALNDMDINYGQGYLFGKPDLEGAYKSRTRARREGLREVTS